MSEANSDLYAHLSERLGVSRDQAAFRCGISPAAFQWLVENGLMPKAKLIRKRLVWHRKAVDEAFNAYMADCMGATAGDSPLVLQPDAEDEYAV